MGSVVRSQATEVAEKSWKEKKTFMLGLEFRGISQIFERKKIFGHES